MKRKRGPGRPPDRLKKYIIPCRRAFTEELRSDLLQIIHDTGLTLDDLGQRMDRAATWKKFKEPISRQYVSALLLGYGNNEGTDGLMGLFRVCEALDLDIFPDLKPAEKKNVSHGNAESSTGS